MIFVWLCVPDQFNRNIHLIMNSTSKHVQKIQKRQDGGTMVILIFQLKFMFFVFANVVLMIWVFIPKKTIKYLWVMPRFKFVKFLLFLDDTV